MWQIQHQCPQCGAPVILDETERLFSCPFCRVRLYLASRECMNYILPPADSAAEELLFIPYWRFKGMVFSCREFSVSSKIIDMSRVAVPVNWMPYSLGIRPQALKLRCIGPDTRGTFYKPGMSVTDIISLLEGQLDASAKAPLLHRAFIGETASMIFAPIVIKDAAPFDAVLNRPIASPSAAGLDALQQVEQKAALQVTFIPCLCPACGWNLEGEKESIVLVCKNCHSAWHSSLSGLEKIAFALLPGAGAAPYYLPFWKIQAGVAGLELSSYADLMKLSNAPVVIKKEMGEMEMSFWVPAFKIAPDVFLMVAQRITMVQPRQDGKQQFTESPLHPVTLPLREAAESIKVLIAQCAGAKKDVFPKLPEISIQTKSSMLAYLPFTSSGSEFINTGMHLSINKNTLKWGTNL